MQKSKAGYLDVVVKVGLEDVVDGSRVDKHKVERLAWDGEHPHFTVLHSSVRFEIDSGTRRRRGEGQQTLRVMS
jgi:hypothetical protein